MEKVLKFKENGLSYFLEAMPFGVLVADLGQERSPVLYANDRISRMAGAPVSGLRDVALSDVMTHCGLDKEAQRQILSKAGGGESSGCDIEKMLEGQTLWYRFDACPVPVTGGKADYILCTLRDQTEEKILEAQLLQSQKLEGLGQLAGGVAHDFNNILSIIDGCARVMLRKSDSDGEAAGYLQRIRDSVQRGADLTRKLLTFGRYNVVVDSLTDMDELIRGQQSLLPSLLDARIQADIVSMPGVFVDSPPDQMAQILTNLCLNARDAMPDGGILTIEVMKSMQSFKGIKKEKGAAHAILRVSDTGKGMNESVKARMFDPFFTTKEQGKGTGLGLATVYGHVRQMGGFIDVKSQPGKGSVISIHLPLSQRPPIHKITQPDEGVKSIRFDGYTALVAEDEPELLDLLAGMLRELGMEVLSASRGDEALEVQKNHDGAIDFLLADVVMPGLNGVRLAKLFQDSRPETKVVFMSGYPSSGQMARILLPEGAYILPKPVDYDRLAHVLYKLSCSENMEDYTDLHRMAGQWSPAQVN